MIPRDGWGNFFAPLNPGWFLQWAVQREAEKKPRSRVLCESAKYGRLCGHSPADPDGSTITLKADDNAIDKRIYRHRNA